MTVQARRRAFTLLETAVAMFLFVLVLGIVFRVLVLNRRSLERPAAAARLTQELLKAQKSLRQDLEGTKLSTVCVYPHPGAPFEPPGISFISCRAVHDDSVDFEMGAVKWQKHIFYTVAPDPGDSRFCVLHRCEIVMPGYPSTAPKSAAIGPAEAMARAVKKRAVARGIVTPHSAFPRQGLSFGARGGFDAYFADAAGFRSETDSWDYRIVAVELTVAELSKATGRLSVLRYPLRITPRN